MMDAPFTSIKRSIARPRLAGESDEARLAYLRELIGTEDRPGGAQAHDCLEFINLLMKRMTGTWPESAKTRTLTGKIVPLNEIPEISPP